MSYDKDGITYNGLGEPLPWEADKVNKLSPEVEEKLKRLRKLYAFARKQNKFEWMKRIEADAKKLKETDDTYERALEVFSPKS